MNLVTDILLLTGLGAFSALLLVITRDRLEPRTTSLITLINAQLPQTQCAQCGYPGCKPYAEAIANRRDPFFIVPAGGADICNIPVPVRVSEAVIEGE